MSRLAEAVLAVTADLSGADLGQILEVPKRTADRWLAELRDSGDLSNWSGTMLERLASWEAREWGTHRLADGLRPGAEGIYVRNKADAAAVARIMQCIIASHQVNSQLLGEMAIDLSDGVLHDHEARRLQPLVAEAMQAAMIKHRALIELSQLLINRLKDPAA
jgi:hypothetical protein